MTKAEKYHYNSTRSPPVKETSTMATMADIAERAGVALSTVSYVLSGKRSVSEETKQRVLRAIADLDYQPHAFARALASKRTQTIALLFPALAKGHSEMRLEFVAQ